MGGSSVPTPPEEIGKTSAMDIVLKAVCAKLEAADDLAQQAMQALRESGASDLALESIVDKMSSIEREHDGRSRFLVQN